MIYNACWVWVKKRISIQKEKKFLVSISHVCTKFENETLIPLFLPSFHLFCCWQFNGVNSFLFFGMRVPTLEEVVESSIK